jgi:hypothetical protein
LVREALKVFNSDIEVFHPFVLYCARDRAAARITQLCERQDRPRCCHRHACLSSLQRESVPFYTISLDLLRKKTAVLYLVCRLDVTTFQAEFLHVTHKFSALWVASSALLRVKARTTREENNVWKLHGSFRQLFSSLKDFRSLFEPGWI